MTTQRFNRKQFDEFKKTVAKTDGQYLVSKIDGSFLGLKGADSEEDHLKNLFKKGITEQVTSQLGFNPTEKKWYGWSHRARYGFGIGHKVKKGDCRDRIPVGFVCKTLADCKKVAKDFARSVS